MAKFTLLIALGIVLSGCSSYPVQSTGNAFEDLYKRIDYREEGKYRVIDIFYASSRKIEEDKKGKLQFTSKMGEETTTGLFDVKISPSLKIGKMLPKRFEKKKEIGIQSLKGLDGDAFIGALKDAVDESPHKSLLVLVFGFKDDAEAVAIETAYFSYMLDVNTPVLLFDWPGDLGVSIGGYKKAQENARASGPYLGDLLAKIIRQVKPEKIWIQGSSLGCQVVCDAFSHMYKEADLADDETEIAHLFMAAPDVGHDEFNDEFKKELLALSDGCTTYISSNDKALLMSAIINGEKRLGRQKFNHKKDEVEETKDMLYLKSLSPDKISLVDVTPINKASYRHGYYLEDSEYFDDVYFRIFSKDRHANRRLYLLKYEDGEDYWVLK
jgi:esterase/lipase superfamily enzyme